MGRARFLHSGRLTASVHIGYKLDVLGLEPGASRHRDCFWDTIFPREMQDNVGPCTKATDG